MSASTNETVLSYSIEASPGNLATTPVFKSIEPNDISTFGATIATAARNPISESRGAKKGSTTDLDSAVELPCDLTIDAFLDFSQGFMYASWYQQRHFTPTAVDATTGYTVTTGAILPENTLIFARGFQNSENNGLKLVADSSTATGVKTTGLITELDPPDSAEMDVVGYQCATGDLKVNSDGNLTSTVLDFDDLNITVGQSIWIGGSTTSTQFFNTANSGLARVRKVEDHILYIDNTLLDFVADDGTVDGDGGTGNTIQIFVGSFLRDVPTTNDKFLRETYTFEATFTGLGDASDETQYEYSKGNYANSFTFSWPGQALASMTAGFVGLDTEPLTETQVTAGSRLSPNKTAGFNTTSDFTRIRIQDADETGLTTYFESLDITINNNVTPKKVIGTLGAAFINVGMLDITGSTSVIFTDPKVISAVRNNETVSLDWAVHNSDGALHFNIPSMTLGGADKSFPRNESITLNISANAFEDEFFGFSLGTTYYPYLP